MSILQKLRYDILARILASPPEKQECGDCRFVSLDNCADCPYLKDDGDRADDLARYTGSTVPREIKKAEAAEAREEE